MSTILILLCIALIPICSPAVASENVTIYRDTWGVPHIYGDSESAVLYGQGYAQAEDRLGTMMKSYRKAVGTMAEAFGQDWVEHDYRQRVFEHKKMARKHYHTLAPEVRRCIEAFVAGVKAYMAEHPEEVPDWAVEPEPYHIVAFARYFIWGWPVGQAWGDLERRPEEPDTGRGSNQWVISKSLSAEDCVIACIDPHLATSGESLFFESHLHGGDLNAYGFVPTGAAFIGLGHNDYLSWAATTGGPDTSDIYEEEVDPEDPLRYRYDGEWRTMDVEMAEISVKTEEGMQTVEREIHFSHHGPIVHREANHAYAMKLPYREQVKLAEQMYRMGKATNLGEFMQALSLFQFMPQNLMYGDIYGNMYYLRTGMVPIRPKGYEWDRPVPGNTSQSEWLGMHALPDLVQLLNPPAGFMQNCNISPGTMTFNSPMTPDRYPGYIYNASKDGTNPRGSRFLEIMEQRQDKITKEQAINMALDIQLFGAEKWQQALVDSYEEEGGADKRPDLAAAVEQIRNWDHRTSIDSTAMTLYAYWWIAGAREVRADREVDAVGREKLLSALGDAVRAMKAVYGTPKVAWGDVHRGKRGDRSWPLAGVAYRGMVTLRAIGMTDPDEDGVTYMQSGQICPTVVFLKQPVHSFSAAPHGQSEDPQSPHYTDQGEELCANLKLKPTWYQRDELMQHLESTLELTLP